MINRKTFLKFIGLGALALKFGVPKVEAKPSGDGIELSSIAHPQASANSADILKCMEDIRPERSGVEEYPVSASGIIQRYKGSLERLNEMCSTWPPCHPVSPEMAEQYGMDYGWVKKENINQFLSKGWKLEDGPEIAGLGRFMEIK